MSNTNIPNQEPVQRTAPNTPVAAGGKPQITSFGYRERIGPHGEFILYEPTIEELMRERAGNVPPLPPIPPPRIPRGKWQGYREYIGPNGEFILYQPSIDELMRENDGDAPNNAPPNNPPNGGIKETVPTTPARPANRPATSADNFPHTVVRPPAPGTPPPVPYVPPPYASGPANDDVDQELLRHREWLRHRFDPPAPTAPPRPDPTRPGSYKRLRDDADETAARIRELERERYDSWLSDDEWDWLFGQELRLQLVHLRSIRWQIEEFEKAYANGDDPVAAVNKYNHEQWEIFLNALNDHIRLLGGAIMNVEAMRAFQQAMEEALREMQAARQRQANDWLRTRERTRTEAAKAAAASAQSQRRIGGLTQRQWDNIINRRQVINKLGTPEGQDALDKRLGEFGQDVSKGQTVGTATRQPDGSVVVRFGNLDADGTLSGVQTSTIPAGEVPPGLEFDSTGTERFSIYNE